MNAKSRIFQTPSELTKFINDPTNGLAAVLSITFDASSGAYVLFYT